MDDLIGLQWSSSSSAPKQFSKSLSPTTEKRWSPSSRSKNATPAPLDSFSGLVDLCRSPAREESSAKNIDINSLKNSVEKKDISDIPVYPQSRLETAPQILQSTPPVSQTDDPFDLPLYKDNQETPRASRHRPLIEEKNDILGILGQPIVVEQENSTVLEVDPRDAAIAAIIEMGFTLDQTLAALSETDTGFNIEAALDILLRQKYTKEHRESDYYSTSSRESPVIPAKWDVREKPIVPSPSLESNCSTPELRPTFFKSIWKHSKAKVQKAVEDLSSDSASQTVPKWMREGSSRESSGTQTPDDNITEEARMLEREKPTRKYEKFTSPPSQKHIKTQAIMSEQRDEIYSSPARRRRKDPESGAERLSLSPKISSVRQPLYIRPQVPLSTECLSIFNRFRLEGSKAFNMGDFSSALESYKVALNALPPLHELSIILLANLALCYVKLGDAKAGLKHANDALLIIGPREGRNEYINVDDTQKDMKKIWRKIVIRKAQALEELERYEEAKEAWILLLNSGLNGEMALQGKYRCEKAMSPTSKSICSVQRPKPSISLNSEAVARLRITAAELAEEESKRLALHDFVSAKVDAWQRGKELNVRALLASLDTVLWPEAGWQTVGMDKLINPTKVKVFYIKAIAKVHPDKIPKEATTEQKMVSASVFAALNKAWDDFRTLNGLF